MWRLAFLSVCVLVFASCGEDEPTPPPRPVALTILTPGDPETVKGATIQLRGRVTPAASEVKVRGSTVDVASGEFVTDVSLDEGMNLVDVSAASPGRRPASTAIRIVRDPRVEVPAVEATNADEAVEELENLGFQVVRRDGGSILDDLLGGDPQVCKQNPPAGTKVKRGAKVEIITARNC